LAPLKSERKIESPAAQYTFSDCADAREQRARDRRRESFIGV
jgi:hypothetical protein